VTSASIAGWIAQAAFWILLVYGWIWNEIHLPGASIFLLLWVGGFVGLDHVAYGAALFSPFVAVLDIALVFIVFKGDVRLT
jgi:hypothetical protein